MAKDKRNITVTADPSPDLLGATFGMAPGANDLEFDKTKDKIKKKDHYTVKFTLVDNSGLNLRFVKPMENAMWVKLIPDAATVDCPTSACSLPSFYATSVTDTVLTVCNTDMAPEYLSFTLNFIRAGGNDANSAEYVPFDPIVTNKNGGDNMQANIVVAAVVVVAVAVAALIGLGW